MHSTRKPFALRSLMVMLAVLCLTGCGLTIPADPDDTLTRVSGAELRVGISHNPPWTDITGVPDGEEPTGIEPDLVGDFAAAHDADVEWTAGGEEELMTMLEDGSLDMVIGGFTDASPWVSKAALTTSYAESPMADGGTNKHVMAVKMGENAFMVALELHLLAQNVGTVAP